MLGMLSQLINLTLLADWHNNSKRRLLGRNFSDPDFQREIRHLPFKVTRHCDSDIPIIEVEIEDRGGSRGVVGDDENPIPGQDGNTNVNKRVLRYTPEQIAAVIFRELKGIVEREIGEE